MSPIPFGLRPGSTKEMRIKLELNLECEICNIRLAHTCLELHYIPLYPPESNVPKAELEGDILLLCPSCHADLHRCGIDEGEQRMLLDFRPAAVRRRLRRILEEEERSIYVPEQDIEESVRNAFPAHWGWGT